MRSQPSFDFGLPDTMRARKGYCLCGCGRRTRIVTHTHRRKGRIAGQPNRYILGHGFASTIHKRFWGKVLKTESCWLWTGCKNKDGYGKIRFNGKTELAHRVAWELANGPLAEGLTIDHVWPKCQNRSCVNLAHLEPVTNKENILRGFGVSATNARKSHCKHGHPLSGGNLYLASNGDRHCRTCRAKHSRDRIR